MRFIIIFLFLLANSQAFAQIDHWESAVLADNIWSYHIGISEPPSDWNSPTFQDVGWLIGQGGIGYGDGDDNTIITAAPSLYMRQKFNIPDKSKIELAILHADYDDGFVAYLNGVEIGRKNIVGNPPLFDADTETDREAEMYTGGNPEAIIISQGQLSQILIDGENVLSVQTHNYLGVNSSDMSSLYWLSFGINDTSNDYSPVPGWFTVPGINTHLPIVKINTNGVFIPDEPSIQGEMGIIWNGVGVQNNSASLPGHFLGNIHIERRGQSSLALFPKNGFAIETKDENWQDVDASFLNFPPEEDWILHGPYSDKTLIRNVLAMQLANNMGQYASRTRIVELYINENYEGIYVLMEKIKRDNFRVNIANLKEENISGDELTGGYVFKIDKDEADWFSLYDMQVNPGSKLGFQYVSPKASQIQPAQAAYIQSYIDSFETALFFPNMPFGGKFFHEYIDLTSFSDHFLFSELSKNVDAYRISTYLHKDKNSNGGRLKMGPVWDYNLGFGNADYCQGFDHTGWVYDQQCGFNNPFWWDRFMNNVIFQDVTKCRWETLRVGPLHIDSIFAIIDANTMLLGAEAIDRNFDRWPVLGTWVWPNPFIHNTYLDEVNYMKQFIQNRLAWMDANMFGTCGLTSITNSISSKTTFKVYPNPARENLLIELPNSLSTNLQLSLLDITGKTIYETSINSKTSSFEVDLFDVPPGIFFLEIIDLETQNSYQERIVKQ